MASIERMFVIDVLDPSTERQSVVLREPAGSHLPCYFLGNYKGQSIALLPKNFDPATHEVLIVQKDARRVWIERESNGGQGIHLRTPYFSGVGWLSGGYEQLGFTVVSGLVADDLVEFVAVATHRPPESETSESRVKQFFQYARWKRDGNSFLVYSDQSSGSDIIGRGETLTAAWQSAVESIARHNPGHEPISPLATETPTGCYSETVAAPVPSL